MPNRIIRDGINSSARINALSMGAEVFYRRLMSVVDDFGRYHGSVVTLRGACWPTNPERISQKDVSKWLTELLKGDDPLVKTYCVAGATYIEIQDFGQRTRSESRFPNPPWQRNDSVMTADCARDAANSPQNARPSRSRIAKAETETDASAPRSSSPPPIEMPRHSDYPLTDAAVRRRFPTADLPLVVRIVESATRAYLSVDHPKISGPGDAEIADAVNQASGESRNQDSAALYLRTVPAVVKSWAELGRHPAGGKSSPRLDPVAIAKKRAEEMRRDGIR